MSDEKIKHNYMCDWCCADKTRIFYLCDGHIKLIANNEIKKAREETEARLTKKFSNYLDRLSETHQKSSLLNVHEVLDEVETYLTERGHGSLGLAVRVRVIEKLSGSDKRGLNRSAGGTSVQEQASERGLKSPAPAEKELKTHD